jgi:hypothetical protein
MKKILVFCKENFIPWFLLASNFATQVEKQNPDSQRLLCNAFSSFEGLLFLLVEDSRVRIPIDFGGFFGLGRVIQASGDFFFFFCRGGKRFKLFGFKDIGGECLFQG